MKKKFFSLLISVLLVSCSTNSEIKPSLISKDVDGYFLDEEFIFPLNTITSLNMYNKDQLNEVYPQFKEMITNLSKEVDRYHIYKDINNLKAINDSCGTGLEIVVSESLFEILKLGVDLTKLTEGKFNLAMGNVIDLYTPLFENSFSSVASMPEENILNQALASVPSYEEIDNVIILNEKNNSVILNQCNDLNVTISLGALAKGFVMQKAYDYLNSFNYDFFFNSGNSTIGLNGKNPLNATGDWKVGLYNPSLSGVDEYLAILPVQGEKFLSTSGDYQQHFFYEDENSNNNIMHHIIDPFTGVSNDYIRCVSLISDNCSLAVLDALSTTLFNVNSEQEIIDVISLFEETYECSINYIISKPNVAYNYNDVDILINKEYEGYVTSFASNVKNVKYI